MGCPHRAHTNYLLVLSSGVAQIQQLLPHEFARLSRNGGLYAIGFVRKPTIRVASVVTLGRDVSCALLCAPAEAL